MGRGRGYSSKKELTLYAFEQSFAAVAIASNGVVVGYQWLIRDYSCNYRVQNIMD